MIRRPGILDMISTRETDIGGITLCYETRILFLFGYPVHAHTFLMTTSFVTFFIFALYRAEVFKFDMISCIFWNSLRISGHYAIQSRHVDKYVARELVYSAKTYSNMQIFITKI